MTAAPLMAALFGLVALHEQLPITGWLGMLLTIFGVAWVILERPRGDGLGKETPKGAPPQPGITAHRLRGVLLAFVGAGCQAGGLLLSKQGIGHGWLPAEHHLPPQTATLIRMVFAGLGMVPIMAWGMLRHRKQLPTLGTTPMSSDINSSEALAIEKNRAQRVLWAGLMFASFGAVTGPFLGVWMSLVASDRVPIGIAQTLCSFTPIFILPFSRAIQKERIGSRAILGALVAVGGLALLFAAPSGG